MLVEGIKSRPTYSGLVPDVFAHNHVLAADADGAEAILDLFKRDGAHMKGRVAIIYTKADGKEDFSAALAALPVEVVHKLPTIATAIQRLKAVLGVARMGTRIYAAGSETMIGLVVQAARDFGMDPQTVFSEHRGTLARRVQCVHCKGFTENVTTNVVVCSHCGANLLVRDHYSKRLAAFQGVCVDAEAPGELPEISEVFK